MGLGLCAQCDGKEPLPPHFRNASISQSGELTVQELEDIEISRTSLRLSLATNAKLREDLDATSHMQNKSLSDLVEQRCGGSNSDLSVYADQIHEDILRRRSDMLDKGKRASQRLRSDASKLLTAALDLNNRADSTG